MKSRAASRSPASGNAEFELGRGAQHVEQGPQGEAAAAVLLQPEVDLDPLDAGGERVGRQRGKVGRAEIAAQLVVIIHRPSPQGDAAVMAERPGIC